MRHNAVMTFVPVNLFTPWLVYWVAAVLVVIGATLVVAGVWRARRHRAFALSTGRNQDIRLLTDTRTQRRLGVGALVVAVLLIGVGVWQHLDGLAAFRSNLETKYGYTQIERIRQSGSGFVADLTLPDGTVLKDEMVLLDPTGEPFVGEDKFRDTVGGD